MSDKSCGRGGKDDSLLFGLDDAVRVISGKGLEYLETRQVEEDYYTVAASSFVP